MLHVAQGVDGLSSGGELAACSRLSANPHPRRNAAQAIRRPRWRRHHRPGSYA